jgi:pimeloyl-ACP methyl ester carboxylesterase
MTAPRTVEHRGCRLAYDVRGDGPPVLMIHGVAVHGDGWRPQTDELEGRYRCLSFDNRGMGRSQPVGAPLTVEQMAEDALALMDAEGWASAHVAGHSLGGLVALHVALSARGRARSLALLCTFARGRDAAPPTPRMVWYGMRSRVGTRRQRRHAFLHIVMPPGALAGADRDAMAARLEPLFGHDVGDQPPVTGKQLAAMRAYDASARLAELADVPTLVVSAAHDPIAPPSVGRALSAGIPGSRYVEVPDASHGVTIQHASRINALLAEHFAGAEARRQR